MWYGSITIVSFLDISNDTDLIDVEDKWFSFMLLFGCLLRVFVVARMGFGDTVCCCCCLERCLVSILD